MTRDTSRDSYHQNNDDGTTRRLKKVILQKLMEIQPATRTMISENTGIVQSSMTHPIRELTDQNLVIELPKDNCKVTGRKAYYYTLSTFNPELF